MLMCGAERNGVLIHQNVCQKVLKHWRIQDSPYWGGGLTLLSGANFIFCQFFRKNEIRKNFVNAVPPVQKELKQNSPPAGNHKRHTMCSITCPSITSLGGGECQSWLGGGGTLSCPGQGGYPILAWLGVPHLVLARRVPHPDLTRGIPFEGYPPGQDWVLPHMGLGYPPGRDL